MAFDTARAAQARWAATPVVERKRAVLRFHDLLLSHRDEGLDLIQWETGKTRMDALKELLGVCTVARHYARDARRLLGPERKVGLFPLLTKVSVEHHPVGVVGDIAPWNYPLFLAAADAIPALMAGNAVVLKPDHQTSLTALWAVDLMHRAGIPRRVLQVVLGYGPELGPGDHRARGLHDVHRVQRRGCADRRPMRRAAHRLLDGARRQEPHDRARRCRPRAGGRDRRAGVLRQRRPAVRRDRADLRPRRGLRRLHGPIPRPDRRAAHACVRGLGHGLRLADQCRAARAHHRGCGRRGGQGRHGRDRGSSAARHRPVLLRARRC